MTKSRTKLLPSERLAHSINLSLNSKPLDVVMTALVIISGAQITAAAGGDPKAASEGARIFNEQLQATIKSFCEIANSHRH